MCVRREKIVKHLNQNKFKSFIGQPGGSGAVRLPSMVFRFEASVRDDSFPREWLALAAVP
jgi:hypothetical protein